MTETITKRRITPGGKPSYIVSADCQRCARVYFPLMLVRATVVEAQFKEAFEKAHYHFAPSFDQSFGELKREATLPAARLLGEGFVFIFYQERGRWDIWRSHADGTYKKLLEMVNVDDYASKCNGVKIEDSGSVCQRGAANLPAGLITLVGPQTQSNIWIAYAHHLWAPQVLKDYAADTHKGRKVRMAHLDAKAWLVNGTLPTGVLPLNEAALKTSVIEFNDNVPPAGPQYNPLIKAFELATVPLATSRFGQAKAMDAAVRAIEKTAGPTAADKALIVMVPDALGVIEQHNHLRLAAQEAKRLWSIGGDGIAQTPDPERPWKLRSSLHADMIEQWEAAREARSITQQTEQAMHKNLREPVTTEEDFLHDQAAGKYPPGTSWEPSLASPNGPTIWRTPTPDKRDVPTQEQWVASRRKPGTQTRLGKLKLPATAVAQAANKRGAAQAKGFRDRLRTRVDWEAMRIFRNDFKAESEQWDKFIARFDRDFLVWRRSDALKTVLLHDFDRTIRLRQPDPKSGTLNQQVADVAARLRAVDMAFGGGAIGPESTEALAALYKLKPDNPESWIDNALWTPFSLEDAVLADPGNRSEAKEHTAGLNLISQQVREALGRERERLRLEEALQSVMATRAQLTNLIASAIDKKTAQALGLEAVSAEEARKAVRVHLSMALLADELVDMDSNVLSRQKYVFNMKVPVGVAIDEVRGAMQNSVIPMRFEPKNETTRQERRYTEQQFRKVEGRIAGDVHYPVLLSRSMIEQLQKEAVTSGAHLVEIVPDARLGLASGPVKVPQHVARRLIREQAVSAREALKQREGKMLFAIGVGQVLALYDTALKIGSTQGIEQADALLSTLSTIAGLVETANLWQLHVWTLKTNGARTLTMEAATAMARLRLGAGLAGATGSAIDAVLAFARADNAKRQGDGTTASAYKLAGYLYSGSAALVFVGSLATYQSFMARGLIMGGLGVRGAALLGGWATGIGLVASIAGFGAMLYALHTEYQMTDIFLDRSYWGNGSRTEGSFGDITRAQLAHAHADRQLNAEARMISLRSLVLWGMEKEAEAFLGLTVGLKVSFSWHKNWFSDEAVALKIEASDWPGKRKVAIQIELLATEGAPGVLVVNSKGVLPDPDRNAEGLYELEVPWVFKNGLHKGYSLARATFNVYDEFERVSVARDTLLVRRGA